MAQLEVILSPAELPALAKRDLRDVVCVVFDVLRATSTFVTALHNGAKAVIPVSEIAEALAIRQKQPDVLLGGERDGVRIRAKQTGGVDFDLGNSPREYTPEKVRGKTIVSTTTNGTRALRACAGAKTVLAASFLNLTATAKFFRQLQPAQIVLVCAGTYENGADEDVLAAGALCEMLGEPNLECGDMSPLSTAPTRRRTPKLSIQPKSRGALMRRQRRICQARFAIQQMGGGCCRFLNCAMTWRSVCNTTFIRSSPGWKLMAQSEWFVDKGMWTVRARRLGRETGGWICVDVVCRMTGGQTVGRMSACKIFTSARAPYRTQPQSTITSWVVFPAVCFAVKSGEARASCSSTISVLHLAIRL